MVNIVHVISSLKIGGAETVLYNIIKNLDNKNFKQSVIYFHDGPIRQEIEQIIPVYNITGKFFKYDIFFLIILLKILKKLKPDVIHSSLWAANFFATICAKILNIPIVCSLHTVKEHEGKIRNIFGKYFLNHANNIIAVSESVARSFSINKSKLLVIPNCVNSKELIEKAELNKLSRANLKLKEQDFVIGSVGRFVKVKNYNILIDAVAILIQEFKNIKLVLIGTGPEYNFLKSKVYNLNLENNIKFIIAQPAYKYYTLFDCFVQPSEFEGLSMALLEALCFKLPCIVTGKNNQHDIILNKYNGIIIEPNNKNKLKSAIRELYTNQIFRKNLSSKTQELITDNFDFSNMINSYSKVFYINKGQQ